MITMVMRSAEAAEAAAAVMLAVSMMLGCVSSHPHCSPGLCQNGGTCQDTPTLFKCFCPPGFTGTTCSDVDHCVSKPCKNGGVCTSLTSSYNCTCLGGYTGPQCQTVVSACSSSPCVNGTCHDLGNSYECHCDAGFTGPRCDVDFDYCSTDPCGGHGTCAEEATGGYSCHCQSDYLGLNCEQHISQRCDNDEENFCMCEVNGASVKVPIPPPPGPTKGVNARDILMGITGLLTGWAVGSGVMALYRCCCRESSYLGDGCCAKAGRRYPARPTGVRPASTSSTVSTIDSIRGDSPDSLADSSGGQRPSSVASSTDTPHRPTNVYRSGFSDTLSHQTAPRKFSGTYASGDKDWK